MSYLARSINCTYIEDTLRLYDDLEQECYKGTHIKIVGAVSIPGLILWALGMPLLGLMLMKRFLKIIEDAHFYSDSRIYNDL